MNAIIKILLFYITVQEKIIMYLMIKLFGKDTINIKSDRPVDKKYRKLQVDDMPIFEKVQKYDYKELLKEYKLKHGKELRPVKHCKNTKNIVPVSITCPCCNAPSIYIYDSSFGRGQYLLCKVCKSTFNRKNRFSKSVILKCPHCLKTLEKIKERKDFFVYKCKNNECSFYKKNLNSMYDEDKKLYKKNPEKFKLHYIYRTFNFKPIFMKYYAAKSS